MASGSPAVWTQSPGDIFLHSEYLEQTFDEFVTFLGMRWNPCHTLPIAFVVLVAGCSDIPAQNAPAAATPTIIVSEPIPDSMPELLRDIESSYRAGKFERGLALVKHALELKQSDVSTFDRIGSVYYVLGRYGDALSFWTQALPLEADAARRATLQRSISSTRASLGLSEPVSTAASKPVPAAALRSDPGEIDRLYRSGIKYYAEGQYLQATDAFLRILDRDPNNALAQRALERLRHESASSNR